MKPILNVIQGCFLMIVLFGMVVALYQIIF
jgi:hypothetical protein